MESSHKSAVSKIKNCEWREFARRRARDAAESANPAGALPSAGERKKNLLFLLISRCEWYLFIQLYARLRAHSIEFFNGKPYARTDYKTIERKHCGKLKKEMTPQDEQAQALQALQGEPSQEAYLGLLRRRFAPPFKGGDLIRKALQFIHAGLKISGKSFQAVRIANGIFLPQCRLSKSLRNSIPFYMAANPPLLRGGNAFVPQPQKSNSTAGTAAFAHTAAKHIFLYFSTARLRVGAD